MTTINKSEDVISERKNNFRYLRHHRKNLRNTSTRAERILWAYLAKSRLASMKFRRQHSFHNYILDFYCPEKRLAIELDGEIHFTKNNPEYDRIRDKFLTDNQIKVLRFSNSQVENDIENVLALVRSATLSPPAKEGLGVV